jgi:assimilatory nitrate reductase catalytic subunit
VRAAVPPPGEARPDWQIVTQFARRLGRKLGNRHAARLFPHRSAEEIFDEHRETTRGRDLDIGGISYSLLERRGPQQWPFPEGATSGLQRLYADGRFPTPSGRARFVDTRYLPVWETTNAAYPLHLNTGRLRDQWHGMSRTGTVAKLFGHAPEPELSMHPEDMKERNLKDGEAARISSARGDLVVCVKASSEQRPGDVYLPMHWGSGFMSGAGTNALTVGAFDPVSKQPELKHAAVQVERAELPHELVVLRRSDEAIGHLQALLQEFPLASLSLFGRTSTNVMFRARSDKPLEAGLLSDLDRAAGGGLRAVSYEDPARAINKKLWMDPDGRIAAARLAGDTASVAWLKEQIASAATVSPALALAPRTVAAVARGRIVCTCFDVSETEIAAAVARGSDLAAVQRTLKCGTSCGSCAPELRRMCAERGPVSAAA